MQARLEVMGVGWAQDYRLWVMGLVGRAQGVELYHVDVIWKGPWSLILLSCRCMDGVIDDLHRLKTSKTSKTNKKDIMVDLFHSVKSLVHSSFVRYRLFQWGFDF